MRGARVSAALFPARLTCQKAICRSGPSGPSLAFSIALDGGCRGEQALRGRVRVHSSRRVARTAAQSLFRGLKRGWRLSWNLY